MGRSCTNIVLLRTGIPDLVDMVSDTLRRAIVLFYNLSTTCRYVYTVFGKESKDRGGYKICLIPLDLT